VVVIITDGYSDSQARTIIQANFLKLANIKIVCIGIVRRGDLGYQELQQIASDPEEVVRLQVDSFDLLRSKLLTLLAVTCPPVPPPGLYAYEYTATQFLPLHAIAMEWYCHRMASVRPSVRPSVTLVDCDHIC